MELVILNVPICSITTQYLNGGKCILLNSLGLRRLYYLMLILSRHFISVTACYCYQAYEIASWNLQQNE
jgi:hypothetical protein